MAKSINGNGGQEKGQKSTDSRGKPPDRGKQCSADAGELSKHQQRRGGQQLSFLGALVAQSALRRFLAPHKGLFSKLSCRRFSRLSTGPDGLFRLALHTNPHIILPVVKEVVLEIVDRAFKRADDVDAGGLAVNLSNAVRIAVRDLGLPRFKYVVYTAVTRDSGQSMLAVSRALWNPKFDRQVAIEHRRDKYIIHVIVFACYHD
ncbi:Tctex1 domain-containing protein [Echinococcus granulosus]|uniref:Tctex1 domain-containing protein n=1 Tax=Echinococcus granulosus TaxID=6210 RepID=W6U3B9_ECHGR|nr:Tctex1 domain-containing protein [Echinococcus granulosus]EUB55041.1 Tctex1 domain-containing protein [Echinococcus granulosus]